ncbi:MAG TPA: formylglycine-generating enzyme family protein [Spirochaetota bacterium]|nr:formylglycine-generating enzyme family protein [Spirochaetota bacterium]
MMISLLKKAKFVLAALAVSCGIQCVSPGQGHRTVPVVKTVGGIEFVRIPGGVFSMGHEECGVSITEECPRHVVQVDSFWIGKYEVSEKQYCRVTGKCAGKGEEGAELFPAAGVSWNDAMGFCREMSRRYGVKARLPYEAEWEYACRGGSDTPYYWGAEMDGDYCWYYSNSSLRNTGRTVHSSREKLPNGYGLYDMSGNLWEWCMDRYSIYYYGESPEKNPGGPPRGELRVLRGGGFNDGAYYQRSSVRNAGGPDIGDRFRGFRVVIPDT